jgi:uncharacterized protein YjiS (DUF1127 family)
MSKPLVQGSIRTLAHISSSAMSWMDTVRIWRARSRERRALRELAELGDHFLKDIGISRGQVLREAAKPFWQR